MKRVVCDLIALGLLVGGAGQASAYLYTVNLSGFLTSVTGPFDSSVQVGTVFHYSFTWDTDIPVYLPFSYAHVNNWLSFGEQTAARVSFGNYSSRGDNNGIGAGAYNDFDKGYQFASDNRDVITHTTVSIVSPSTVQGISLPDGYMLFSRVAFFSANPPDPFTDALQHPTTDYLLSHWQQKDFTWEIYAVPTGTPFELVSGVITAVDVIVPEPASLLLLATGTLGLIGWAWWRRRRTRLLNMKRIAT